MGNGWISQFICKTLNDTVQLSHCGILINSVKGDFDVIHVLSKEISSIDGVQRCTLDQFTADSQKGSIHIVRMKSDLAHLLTEKATYYLNKKIPFDHTFNPQDSTAFFCSELLLHILKYHAGIDLFPFPPTNLPKFSLFFDKRHFTNVLPAPYFLQPSPETLSGRTVRNRRCLQTCRRQKLVPRAESCLRQEDGCLR